MGRSPAWEKTLLIITYDEHGGFYDHLQPPKAADDRPAMRRYGPRVPALVVSPWVELRSVSNTIFDHTSIIKTILTRFCAKPDGTIPKMGTRVAAAAHLGELLSAQSPRAAIPQGDYEVLLRQSASWHEGMVHSGLRTQAELGPVAHELTDFQADFLGAKQDLLAARRQLAAAEKQWHAE